MTIIECLPTDAYVDDKEPTGIACCECGELFPTVSCIDCDMPLREACAVTIGDRCRECNLAIEEPVNVSLDRYLEFMGL